MSKMFDISLDNISVIKNLWEKNRQFHEESSKYFGSLYSSLCFEERMRAFEALDKDCLKITVAKDGEEYIGYCISTAVKEKGEIESIHVVKDKRGSGIGKALVDEHLKWMKENNCKVIGVSVSEENEPTIKFYEKLGFYPNTIYMQQLMTK